MKRNKLARILTSVLLVLALTMGMCFVVGAEDNSGAVFSCEGDENGVTTISLALEGLDSKRVDYAQFTLTAPTGLSFVKSSAVAADSGLEIASYAIGSKMIVVITPASAGFAGVGDGKLLTFQVTGAKGSTEYAFSGNMILCYTNGADTEKQIQGTVTTPAPAFSTRLEAETDAVLWRYPATSEQGLSGTVAGNISLGKDAYMQTYEALAGGAWLDKSQQPMVSYTVDVPADGVYTAQVTYRFAMKAGNKADYFLTLSVDDAAYYKAMYAAHPDNGSYSQGTFDIELTAGRHVIRVLPVLADVRTDSLKVDWLNVDYMDLIGPGQVTAVAPQQTHLQSAGAAYKNLYSKTESGSAAWIKSTLGGYSAHVATKNAGITAENFTVYQLNDLGWFAYTVEVPADGYYDLQTYLNTGWRGTGKVLLLVDGVKHIIPVTDEAGTTFDYNAQNLSCYLTKGTHTLLVSGILAHSADPKGNGGYVDWCNLGALSVSGGITLAQTQVNPATWAERIADVYVSADGDDTGLGTAGAPVASLDAALERVKDGGKVHVVGTFTATADFVWPSSAIAATVTGGTLDFSALTRVDLNSPVTFDNVTVKIADGASIYACGNTVKVNENVTVTGVGYIFGGKYNANVTNTNLTVLSGTWLGIYGGGGSASTRGDVTGTANVTVGGNINPNIDISNHDIENNVYGGSRRGQVAVTNVTVNGGKMLKVYGGGSGVKSADWCDFGTTNVTINGGTMMGVYGGNAFGAGDGRTVAINVTINGGVMDQVFGGSEWAKITGNITVRVNGGEITRRLYGGSYQADITGNVRLILGEGLNYSRTYPKNPSESISARCRSGATGASYLIFASAAARTKLEKELANDPADNWGTASVEQMGVSLKDDITANMRIALEENLLAVTTIKVADSRGTVEHKASEMNLVEGYLLISNAMPATMMADVFTVDVIVDGVSVQSYETSIRQYADYVLDPPENDTTITEKDQALVKEMLNYGAAAQTHFGHNTENSAIKGLDMTGVGTNDVPTTGDKLAGGGNIEGVTPHGATLVCRSKIAVRFLFKLENGAEGLTFKVGDTPVTPVYVAANDWWQVEATDIAPQNLDKDVQVTVTDGVSTFTMTYSPLTYMIRMNNKETTSSTMKALLKAMYNYYLAAADYA